MDEEVRRTEKEIAKKQAKFRARAEARLKHKLQDIPTEEQEDILSKRKVRLAAGEMPDPLPQSMEKELTTALQVKAVREQETLRRAALHRIWCRRLTILLEEQKQGKIPKSVPLRKKHWYRYRPVGEQESAYTIMRNRYDVNGALHPSSLSFFMPDHEYYDFIRQWHQEDPAAALR